MANRYFIATAVVLYVVIGSVLSHKPSNPGGGSRDSKECKRKCESNQYCPYASATDPFQRDMCFDECINSDNPSEFECADPPPIPEEHKTAVENLFREYENLMTQAIAMARNGNYNEAIDAIMELYDEKCLFAIYLQQPGLGLDEMKEKYRGWLMANINTGLESCEFTTKGGAMVAGDANKELLSIFGEFRGYDDLDKKNPPIFTIPYMKILRIDEDDLKMYIDIISGHPKTPADHSHGHGHGHHHH